MNSEDGTVYMLPGDPEGDEEWVSPEPADDVITAAVLRETPLTEADVDAIASYVDEADLRAVVGEGESESITFEVEGHDVTVTAENDVTVA
ncbi:hypothetical protein [Haloarcula marina]|uniref:hypothetical protein n=1 Tax=Haloarcula marina TaxID=2961574 RepID=UPI0020B711D0|nr:hypothetical protein [Halomicroarcula marina]